MRSLVWFVVAGLLATALLGSSAARAANEQQSDKQRQVAEQKQKPVEKQGQTQDQRRYTFHNGEWWYWLPADRWVYWRDNRWNNYDAKTYIPPGSPGMIAPSQTGSAYASRSAGQADIGPFYGHTTGQLDRRPLEANNEIGPFYGHALPSEVFGPWRACRAIRPFYGHATLSDDN
jgi:hypothetical protein